MLNICEKEQMTDKFINVVKSKNYAKWQKSNTKEYILIYRNVYKVQTSL